MTDEEYQTYISDLVTHMVLHKDDYFADKLVTMLVEDHPANEQVILAAKALKVATPAQIQAAFARKRKRDEAAARKAECEAKLIQSCGTIDAETEREFVCSVVQTQTEGMDYGCCFSMKDGGKKTKTEMTLKIQLDAADCRITKPPLGLVDKNFERALTEYCQNKRAERRAEIWQRIGSLSADRDAVVINRAARRMFKHVFKDAPLAEAAVKSVMWAVKRKMQDTTIPEHHCFFLYGRQDAGKTVFWRYIKAAILDLCKNIDVCDLTDPRQLDIFRYSLLDCDELSKADRADMAKFKSVVSADFISRRKYYTQEMEDVPMCGVIIGTTNKPLDEVFQDPTGMRRFVQIDIKPRHEVPNWQTEVADFDWLGLWQVVDHLADDPLLPFMGELREAQERSREKDRVEQFLESFEYNEARHKRLLVKEGSEPPERLQFTAHSLFKDVFKEFERWATPGQEMHLGTWGRRMKALINDGRFPEWQHHVHCARTWYTYTKSDAIPHASD